MDHQAEEAANREGQVFPSMIAHDSVGATSSPTLTSNSEQMRLYSASMIGSPLCVNGSRWLLASPYAAQR
jgi:hypothetical protein